jgi:hypothetical protein
VVFMEKTTTKTSRNSPAATRQPQLGGAAVTDG